MRLHIPSILHLIIVTLDASLRDIKLNAPISSLSQNVILEGVVNTPPFNPLFQTRAHPPMSVRPTWHMRGF